MIDSHHGLFSAASATSGHLRRVRVARKKVLLSNAVRGNDKIDGRGDLYLPTINARLQVLGCLVEERRHVEQVDGIHRHIRVRLGSIICTRVLAICA